MLMKVSAVESMERWYRQVGPDLLAYFRYRHGHPQVAEDLLQDTFMQAMKHPERILAADSPRAYLFGIARNLSLETFRRQRPEGKMPLELPAETGDAPDPRLEPMREAITKLPPTHAEVLLLRLQQELSYEEIAQVLDVPIGTVRSRLHHAVQQLREALNHPSLLKAERI